MEDHFETSGVFETSKFDISKLACINFSQIGPLTVELAGLEHIKSSGSQVSDRCPLCYLFKGPRAAKSIVGSGRNSNSSKL